MEKSIENSKQQQKQIEQFVFDSNGNQINLSKQKWSKWTDHQMLKYCVFINIFQKQYTYGKRRPNMLFKLMSKLIKTKNISQCRTFTYKMEKQYRTFQSIVNSIERKHQPQVYNQYFEKYKKQIINLTKENPASYKNCLSNDIIQNIQRQKFKKKFKQIDEKYQRDDFVHNYPCNNTKKQAQRPFYNIRKSNEIYRKQQNTNFKGSVSQQNTQYFKTNITNEHIQRLRKFQAPSCINQQMRRIYNQHQLQSAIRQKQMIMKKKFEQIQKQKIKQYLQDPFILSLNKNQIINKCNFHWNQWLKYSLQLDALQSKDLILQNKTK